MVSDCVPSSYQWQKAWLLVLSNVCFSPDRVSWYFPQEGFWRGSQVCLEWWSWNSEKGSRIDGRKLVLCNSSCGYWIQRSIDSGETCDSRCHGPPWGKGSWWWTVSPQTLWCFSGGLWEEVCPGSGRKVLGVSARNRQWTHIKSKENLNFWSERPQNHEWLKMVWVEFGCPGHGKGPWDGLGAMVKTKVTLDITHGKERTMTGKITSSILVTEHLWATFCTNKWLMEHVDSRINEMVVMYQSAEQVIRPSAPSDVSVCKDIMSCFSFLFLGVPRHYATRPFSCWYKACSRVRGRGLGSQSIDWSVCLLALKHLVSLQVRMRPSVQTELDLHTTDRWEERDRKIKKYYICSLKRFPYKRHLAIVFFSPALPKWCVFAVLYTYRLNYFNVTIGK